RCPAGVLPLVGDTRHTLPAALLARYRNGIADRYARALDPIQAAIAKADDDLPWCVSWIEGYDFTRAALPEEGEETLRIGSSGASYQSWKRAGKYGKSPENVHGAGPQF